MRNASPDAALPCSSTCVSTLILGDLSNIEAFNCTSDTALSGSWQELPGPGKADVSIHSSRRFVSVAHPTYVWPVYLL